MTPTCSRRGGRGLGRCWRSVRKRGWLKPESTRCMTARAVAVARACVTDTSAALVQFGRPHAEVGGGRGDTASQSMYLLLDMAHGWRSRAQSQS
jgi:hypothetical protein